MPRHEFTKKTKREALARADGRCEGILTDTGERCPCFLALGKYHFDHIIADGIGGKNDLANCQVLCLACHDEKTDRDKALIARAKRREDRHRGIYAPKREIQSAGFRPSRPQRKATTPPEKRLPARRWSPYVRNLEHAQ